MVTPPDDEPGPAPEDGIPDDRLRLIFTCCHPALAMDARVALALRTLCGLTVEEIARSFGVAEPAMQKRRFRARGKIRHAGIPYRVPPAHLLPEPVSDEAIRLTRVLVTLMPDEPEALGLLALGTAARLDDVGPYQLQAAIVAWHATAVHAADTDWDQIVLLYGGLARIAPSPYVELAMAIAVAMADGPAAGLGLLDALDATGDLDGYHLLPAARADLRRRAGRLDDAAAAYRAALGLVRNDAT